MLKAKTSKILFWIFVIFVLIFSLTPATEIQKAIFLSDKVIHFGAFLVLSFLMLTAYKFSKPVLTSLLILGTFGLGIEFIQYFTPYSRFSIYDLAADIVGVFGGVILSKVIYQ